MDKKIIKMHNNPPNITKEVFTIITKIVNNKFKDIRKKNPDFPALSFNFPKDFYKLMVFVKNFFGNDALCPKMNKKRNISNIFHPDRANLYLNEHPNYKFFSLETQEGISNKLRSLLEVLFQTIKNIFDTEEAIKKDNTKKQPTNYIDNIFKEIATKLGIKFTKLNNVYNVNHTTANINPNQRTIGTGIKITDPDIVVVPGHTDTAGAAYNHVPPGSFYSGFDYNRYGHLQKYDIPNYIDPIGHFLPPLRYIEMTKPTDIMQTPVTITMFKEIMGYNPTLSEDEKEHIYAPVGNVTWGEAIEYTMRLSLNSPFIEENQISQLENYLQKIEQAISKKDEGLYYRTCIEYLIYALGENGTGLYRLLTATEGERIYRAGTSTLFPWGDTIEDLSILDSFAHTALNKPNLSPIYKIGDYKANKWGFYNLCGSPLEWRADEHFNIMISSRYRNDSFYKNYFDAYKNFIQQTTNPFYYDYDHSNKRQHNESAIMHGQVFWECSPTNEPRIGIFIPGLRLGFNKNNDYGDFRDKKIDRVKHRSFTGFRVAVTMPPDHALSLNYKPTLLGGCHKQVLLSSPVIALEK